MRATVNDNSLTSIATTVHSEEKIKKIEEKLKIIEEKIKKKEYEITLLKQNIQNYNNKVIEKEKEIKNEEYNIQLLKQSIQEDSKIEENTKNDINLLKQRIKDKTLSLEPWSDSYSNIIEKNRLRINILEQEVAETINEETKQRKQILLTQEQNKLKEHLDTQQSFTSSIKTLETQLEELKKIGSEASLRKAGSEASLRKAETLLKQLNCCDLHDLLNNLCFENVNLAETLEKHWNLLKTQETLKLNLKLNQEKLNQAKLKQEKQSLKELPVVSPSNAVNSLNLSNISSNDSLKSSPSIPQRAEFTQNTPPVTPAPTTPATPQKQISLKSQIKIIQNSGKLLDLENVELLLKNQAPNVYLNCDGVLANAQTINTLIEAGYHVKNITVVGQVNGLLFCKLISAGITQFENVKLTHDVNLTGDMIRNAFSKISGTTTLSLKHVDFSNINIPLPDNSVEFFNHATEDGVIYLSQEDYNSTLNNQNLKNFHLFQIGEAEEADADQAEQQEQVVKKQEEETRQQLALAQMTKDYNTFVKTNDSANSLTPQSKTTQPVTAVQQLSSNFTDTDISNISKLAKQLRQAATKEFDDSQKQNTCEYEQIGLSATLFPAFKKLQDFNQSAFAAFAKNPEILQVESVCKSVHKAVLIEIGILAQAHVHRIVECIIQLANFTEVENNLKNGLNRLTTFAEKKLKNSKIFDDQKVPLICKNILNVALTTVIVELIEREEFEKANTVLTRYASTLPDFTDVIASLEKLKDPNSLTKLQKFNNSSLAKTIAELQDIGKAKEEITSSVQTPTVTVEKEAPTIMLAPALIETLAPRVTTPTQKETAVISSKEFSIIDQSKWYEKLLLKKQNRVARKFVVQEKEGLIFITLDEQILQLTTDKLNTFLNDVATSRDQHRSWFSKIFRKETLKKKEFEGKNSTELLEAFLTYAHKKPKSDTTQAFLGAFAVKYYEEVTTVVKNQETTARSDGTVAQAKAFGEILQQEILAKAAITGSSVIATEATTAFKEISKQAAREIAERNSLKNQETTARSDGTAAQAKAFGEILQQELLAKETVIRSSEITEATTAFEEISKQAARKIAEIAERNSLKDQEITARSDETAAQTKTFSEIVQIELMEKEKASKAELTRKEYERGLIESSEPLKLTLCEAVTALSENKSNTITKPQNFIALMKEKKETCLILSEDEKIKLLTKLNSLPEDQMKNELAVHLRWLLGVAFIQNPGVCEAPNSEKLLVFQDIQCAAINDIAKNITNDPNQQIKNFEKLLKPIFEYKVTFQDRSAVNAVDIVNYKLDKKLANEKDQVKINCVVDLKNILNAQKEKIKQAGFDDYARAIAIIGAIDALTARLSLLFTDKYFTSNTERTKEIAESLNHLKCYDIFKIQKINIETVTHEKLLQEQAKQQAEAADRVAKEEEARVKTLPLARIEENIVDISVSSTESLVVEEGGEEHSHHTPRSQCSSNALTSSFFSRQQEEDQTSRRPLLAIVSSLSKNPHGFLNQMSNSFIENNGTRQEGGEKLIPTPTKTAIRAS